MANQKNPTPQEIIAGLVYFNRTELPLLQADINSIGPSLTNSTNCLRRLHNIVTYLVRHCLQNVVAAAATAQGAQAAEDQQHADAAQLQAALAAAAASPLGVAVPMPTSVPQGMTSIPISSIPSAPTSSPIRNVVVGRNDDATMGLGMGLGAGQAAEMAEPEPTDVPLVIIGQGGSRVIPPKGSKAAPKVFAPGAPIDTTFATVDDAAAPAGQPEVAKTAG
jgi:hypothetical protein